jgi:hypothetical protein
VSQCNPFPEEILQQVIDPNDWTEEQARLEFAPWSEQPHQQRLLLSALRENTAALGELTTELLRIRAYLERTNSNDASD